MRRLTAWERERQIRRALHEMVRNKKAPPAGPRSAISVSDRARKQVLAIIDSPAQLSFLDDCGGATAFKNKICGLGLERGRRIFLRMHGCQHVSPEAALVLAAEIQRIKWVHGDDAVNGISPLNPAAKAMLHDVGFFTHLGIRQSHPFAGQDRDSLPSFMTIRDGNELMGGHVSHELGHLVFGSKVIPNKLLESDVLRALNEALTNIEQHAYPDGHMDASGSLKRGHWWVAGYRDIREKQVTFLAYDQGIGIPSTIRAKPRDLLLKFFSGQVRFQFDLSGLVTMTDAGLIQLAMEMGRTNTGTSGRGKVLPDMRRLIDTGGGDSFIRILSGTGSYLYAHGQNEALEQLPQPFNGTLVVWRLSNSPQLSWDENDEQSDPETH